MAFEDFFGEEGNRLFEYGLDRGVFYPKDGESDAQPWMGLTNLKITSDGAKTEPVVVNGFVQAYDVSPGTFKAVLDCFTAPSNFFKVADGIRFLENEAFSATDQGRESFDLSWRTRIGDDIVGDNGDEYKIHLLYDAYASPSARNYSTITAETDLVKFSYDLVAVPQAVDGALPTAHFVIDTRPLHPYLVNQIEQILYSSVGSLPTLDSLMAMASEEPPVVLNNYTTNPSFEAAGSTVEVWRNMTLRSVPQSSDDATIAYYSANVPAESAVSYQGDGVVRLTVTSPMSALNGLNARGVSVVAGSFHAGKVDVRYSSDAVPGRAPRVNTSTTIAMSTGYTPSTEWVTADMRSTLASPDTGAANIFVYIDASSPVGSYVEVRFPRVQEVSGVGVSASLPAFQYNYSPDPDLTPSWTGTPNASASVLRGTRALTTGVNGLPIQSEQWASDRSKSLRFIRLAEGAAHATRVASTQLVGTGKWRYVRATVRQDTPFTWATTTTLEFPALYVTGNSPSPRTLFTGPTDPGVGVHTRELVLSDSFDSASDVIVHLGSDLTNTPIGTSVWVDSVVALQADTEAELHAQIAALDEVGGYFDGYTDNGKWGYGEWDLNPDASYSHYRSFGPKPKKA